MFALVMKEVQGLQGKTIFLIRLAAFRMLANQKCWQEDEAA